ncbi:uncharacterized protein N7518_006929 [Penicillium psychrosexuale]|uniref:uncharacterized protein n=1 Tax=Penicillium psychrosexuale TaxID=1002107 RepID=UPI0025459F0D|nr:uncharacterized protein N7518_006929 [Penicillium psychrosexuale]KAJ5789918.1 hypothetical protein N7518_006929 [Penicillium psychrosexuale]
MSINPGSYEALAACSGLVESARHLEDHRSHLVADDEFDFVAPVPVSQGSMFGNIQKRHYTFGSSAFGQPQQQQQQYVSSMDRTKKSANLKKSDRTHGANEASIRCKLELLLVCDHDLVSIFEQIRSTLEHSVGTYMGV